MNCRALFIWIKNRVLALTSCLNSATPRVQLFFIANLIKLLGAAVIGLASFLNFPPLSAGASLLLFLWLGLMLAVAIPQTDVLLAAGRRWLRITYRLSLATLAIVVGIEALTVAAVMTWGAVSPATLPSVAQAVKDAFVPSDAEAFTVQATENLLAGRNPYAQANAVAALGASPEAYNKITPLRTGVFASSFPYPAEAELKDLWYSAIARPEASPPEIENKFNYPAGSFLLPAPFLALGISDLRIVLTVLLLPALIYAVLRVAPHQRWHLVLGLLLAVEMWNTTFASDTRLLYLPFILVGWLAAPRRPWLSAVFMGIAVATKQTAWFFLPFYLILVWQTIGPRSALRSGIIIGAVFVAANAPFIVADPGLWLSSVMAPMTDDLFPMGAGAISLITSGLIRLDRPVLFTILEVAVFIAGIAWYLPRARRYPHAGLIIAVIPLFFAWRSLWGYFYFVDIIMLSAILSYKGRRADRALPSAIREQPPVTV